ncbi:MAG: lysozyme inhibitor LprI family protein [Crocinitomicaceae bacterium]|nr:DUF1311 domain-containing protein [Crocinitomicaceae bacterium]
MKPTAFLPLLFIFLYINVSGQDTTDVHQLKNLEYMKYKNNVNCDSTNGSNLEHRICLNLEFQEKDSILNLVFVDLLKHCYSEEEKKTHIEYHNTWLAYRRKISRAESDGYNGHMLGIMYLSTMVYLTEKRTEELLYLTNN